MNDTKERIFSKHFYFLIAEIIRRDKFEDWRVGKYSPSSDTTFPKVLLTTPSKQTEETVNKAKFFTKEVE